MALGFSSGLLTGLQQYGQGGGAIPADPRQRNVMQAAGVTNPLLQRFGQGLGGMLGTEMRSPAAIQQAQLTEQVGAIKDPSSYEGMVQLAQAVMKIDPIQGAQLLAKAEEMKKAEFKTGLQQQATLTKINESSLDQTKKNQIIKDYMSGVIDAGDVEKALKSPTPDYDITEQEIVQDGKTVKVQVLTDKNNPTAKPIIRQIGEVAPDDEKGYKSFLETKAGSDAYKEVNTQKKTYQGKTQQLSSLIASAEKLKEEKTGGILGRFREFVVTDIAGLGDELSVFTTNLNKLRMEQALDLLPKGPASDRDVALALDAAVNPNNLEGDQLISYLKGMQKINKAAQEYYTAKEEYIMQTEDANAIGFEQWAGIVAQERQLEAEKSQNPAVVGEIMNVLTQAANAESPEKQQAMFEYAREVQQNLISEGKLDSDILGIIEERGRLQTLFDDVKKRKNIASFRGY